MCAGFFCLEWVLPAILNFCADVVRMSSLHQAFGKERAQRNIFCCALYIFYLPKRLLIKLIMESNAPPPTPPERMLPMIPARSVPPEPAETPSIPSS